MTSWIQISGSRQWFKVGVDLIGSCCATRLYPSPPLSLPKRFLVILDTGGSDSFYIEIPCISSFETDSIFIITI